MEGKKGESVDRKRRLKIGGELLLSSFLDHNYSYLGSPFVENYLHVEDFAILLKKKERKRSSV